MFDGLDRVLERPAGAGADQGPSGSGSAGAVPRAGSAGAR
jgi:hypothetical protein